MVNNNITLDKILEKRLKYLIRFSEKEKNDGYRGLNNLRIENNSILFDDGIEDCRYNETSFFIVGDEGEEEINLNDDLYLEKIQKASKIINCKGIGNILNLK